LTLEVAFSGELNQLQEYIALDPRFIVQKAEDATTIVPATELVQPASSVEQGKQEVEGEASEASGPAYQSLPEGDEQDAADAFESLYEVLYYRWQRAPGRGGSNS